MATFTWSASDPDNNPLSYVVQYSKDAGTTWQTLISNLTATSYEVNLQALAGTNRGLLRVLASDGFNTAQDQSNALFTIARHRPQSFIQSPENNRLFVGEQTIILEGRGYDNEDGLLADARLTWASDLNGALGTGSSLAIKASQLAEGMHTITLTASDSESQTGNASIKIQIARNRPALPPRISAAPTGISFQAEAGGPQTEPQNLAVRNSGDGTINWIAQTNQPWLRLAFTTGITPANLPVAVDPKSLSIGEYTGQITITSPDVPGSQQVVEVVLNVNKQSNSDVSVSISASPATVVATSQIAYTISLRNNGPGTSSSVILTDNLPNGLTFVSCAATGGGVCNGTGNNRTVTFPSLASGASATITLIASVNCGLVGNQPIINTVTVTSATPDPNPGNNSATATVNPAPGQAKLSLSNGGSSIDFGTTAINREPNPSPPSNTFSIENTGCAPLSVRLAVNRTGADVSSGKITNPDDSAAFPINLINADGTETPLTFVVGSAQLQISGGQRLRFRIAFNPMIPAPANATTNLSASHVLPAEITSALTIAQDGGGTQAVPLIGLISTRAKMINPLATRLAPLVVLAKTGVEYAVEFSAYDSNLDIYLAAYQFLDSAGRPIGDAPNFDLIEPIRQKGVLKGQSFTVVQRFVATSLRTEPNKVRVTLYDREGSETVLSGEIGKTVGRVVNVSAASFSNTALASEAITSAFGSNLAATTQVATTAPLPTSLAGTRVFVRDSANVERPAPLFFVAPGQINYQIPRGTASGIATVTVARGDEAVATGTVQITTSSPGLFAANANGQGIAAAVALRVRANGSQVYEPVAQLDTSLNRFVPRSIDLGPENEQVFLILFGTGIRNRVSPLPVLARIGGIDAPVLYAGSQGSLVGADQVNLRVPRSLVGRGEVDVTLTVDGKTSNTVRVSVR